MPSNLQFSSPPLPAERYLMMLLGKKRVGSRKCTVDSSVTGGNGIIPSDGYLAKNQRPRIYNSAN